MGLVSTLSPSRLRSIGPRERSRIGHAARALAEFTAAGRAARETTEVNGFVPTRPRATSCPFSTTTDVTSMGTTLKLAGTLLDFAAFWASASGVLINKLLKIRQALSAVFKQCGLRSVMSSPPFVDALWYVPSAPQGAQSNDYKAS